MELQTNVSGDPEGGWIVELHDGAVYTSHGVYAATEEEAIAKAKELREAGHGAPGTSYGQDPEPEASDDDLAEAAEHLDHPESDGEAGKGEAETDQA